MATQFARSLAICWACSSALALAEATEDQLQREVDSLMKLKAQTRAAKEVMEAEATRRSSVDAALGAEAFAGEASAASVAQALLEEENKELRQELQKRMPQQPKASLLESSRSSVGSAEAQARWKLVAFLQVTMVLATALVLVLMYFGTRNLQKEDRPKLRYGTDSISKVQGKRLRSPKGVVDEDEEQALSDLQFARPQEVWTRS